MMLSHSWLVLMLGKMAFGAVSKIFGCSAASSYGPKKLLVLFLVCLHAGSREPANVFFFQFLPNPQSLSLASYCDFLDEKIH
jgi:hypothetical protein